MRTTALAVAALTLGAVEGFAGMHMAAKRGSKGTKGAASAPRGFGAASTGSSKAESAPGGPGSLSQSTTAAAATASSQQQRRSPQTAASNAQETEMRIRAALAELSKTDPQLHRAVQLTQALNQWEARTRGLSILQQAALDVRDVNLIKDMKEELNELLRAGISELSIAAAFQQATWDAVASTRADGHRRAEEQLPASAVSIMARISDAIVGGRPAEDLKVLDIGTGTGVLIRFARKAGVREANVVGLDLSAAMLAEARATYPRAAFLRANFMTWDGALPPPPAEAAAAVTTSTLKFDPASGTAAAGASPLADAAAPTSTLKCDHTSTLKFDTVCFNAVLHHLPDARAALARAAALLRAGGRVVISHPKGGGSVAKQHRHNTLLVPSLMPTAAELAAMAPALGLKFVPEESVDSGDVYIATLVQAQA
ncbi:S-adenosyl-L-methionine-dependent methyltransferase [Tribonema minus]|uniref:S-adenosyl-L-methionine-dependent methyltransferase n=1 Tax=Tribonema minus TaxID=303371 RepID=A0A835YK28_9STRA|nr:S-adenosyl-L-methionine-dependent methyltransferase [Tribonema minus]